MTKCIFSSAKVDVISNLIAFPEAVEQMNELGVENADDLRELECEDVEDVYWNSVTYYTRYGNISYEI